MFSKSIPRLAINFLWVKIISYRQIFLSKFDNIGGQNRSCKASPTMPCQRAVFDIESKTCQLQRVCTFKAKISFFHRK
jgi:hypothetical protein